MADNRPIPHQAPAGSSPGIGLPPLGAATPSARRGVPRPLLLGLAIVVLALVGFVGYRYYVDQSLYVSTDNAAVAGAMIQVGGLNGGQVAAVSVDSGDRVARDQVVATLVLPTAVSVAADGTPKLGFNGTDDQQVQVRSPLDGIVVARLANPGDRVVAGQALVTVVDPNRLWVQANIEETRVGRVHVGQQVDVTLDCVGRTLPGRITSVGGATGATFSLLPTGNASGNFTKVTQLVPVKITFEYGRLPLVLGSSAEVKIRVQE